MVQTNTRQFLLLPLILLFLAGTMPLFGQKSNNKRPDFDITSAYVNEDRRSIEVGLMAIERPNIKVSKKNLIVKERIGSKEFPLKIDRIYRSASSGDTDTVNILFLVDVSGSMRRDQRLTKAKSAIQEALVSMNLPKSYFFFLSSFDNDITPSIPINKTNCQDFLNELRPGSDTDLYRAIKEKTEELQTMPGKGVLILLSDGKDDTARNPFYRNNPRVKREEVINLASSLDTTAMICAIGLGSGADAAFLREVVHGTPSSQDKFIPSESAEELRNIFLDLLTDVSSNYMVTLLPGERPVYEGEERELLVEWKPAGSLKTQVYSAGSPNNPVNIAFYQAQDNSLYYPIRSIIGVVIIAALLAILYFGIPLYRKREFKIRHVIKYKSEPNKVKRDPITQEAFRDGDLVVAKCQQVTSLGTWQMIGHCPNYPNCMEYTTPCDGSGAPETEANFWSQQGIYKPLNWLWFGGVGGYLGWGIFVLMNLNLGDWFTQIISSILLSEPFSNFILQFEGGDQLLQNTSTLAEDMLAGIAIGTGISMAISWVSERSDSRKMSFLRIFMRTFLGFLASLIIFFAGFLAQYLIIGIPYVSGLVIWVVFGMVLGLILSIRSSVEWRRGLFGGLLASLIAFQVFYLIGWVFVDFELARLIGFIALGAILGYILVQVLSTLEDYELMYLTPKRYNGIVKPISKWLKKGMTVSIGTSSKCHIYIKWTDESVASEHARLQLNQGKVILEPLEETLVNSQLISIKEKKELENNDIIQLGSNSMSKMQFVEKVTYINQKTSFWARLFKRKKRKK